DPQLREILGTQLDDGDRFVHAAHDGLVLLEDLHQDVRVAIVRLQDVDGSVEVDVAVIALADALDRQPKDRRVETLAFTRRRLGYRFRGHGTRRRSSGTADSAPRPGDR